MMHTGTSTNDGRLRMDVLRAIARPMMGSMFIYGGLDSVKQSTKKAPAAAPVVEPVIESFDLPGDIATWVRVNGVVQIAAGTALALGKMPRLAALVLAGSLVPTTLAGHRFWEEGDPAKRAGQTVHFLKNVSMLGGLLLAADDTGGRPSIPWRIQQAAGHARERVPVLADD
jgi:putative oxidoreductase